jgi:hypothetical protein
MSVMPAAELARCPMNDSPACINRSERILLNPYTDLAEGRDGSENASITSNDRITTAPLFDAANLTVTV